MENPQWVDDHQNCKSGNETNSFLARWDRFVEVFRTVHTKCFRIQNYPCLERGAFESLATSTDNFRVSNFVLDIAIESLSGTSAGGTEFQMTLPLIVEHKNGNETTWLVGWWHGESLQSLRMWLGQSQWMAIAMKNRFSFQDNAFTCTFNPKFRPHVFNCALQSFGSEPVKRKEITQR